MIWVLIALLGSVLLLGLSYPFLRREKLELSDGLGAFDGQLDELRRDRELDLIGEEEAAIAERDVRRRYRLAETAAEGEAAFSPMLRKLGLISTAATVLIAFALYWHLGSAHLVGLREEPQPDMPEDMQAVLDEIDNLADQLMANPDNLEGWVVLGQAYQAMGRYNEAAIAFNNAIDLEGQSAFLYASLGQAYLFAEGGNMSPAAQEAFSRALDLDPK